MNNIDIEQPVRLVSHQDSFFRSELMKMQSNNSSDQEEIDVARRAHYKPRAAIFILDK